jgi:hypothetical protein
MKRKTQTPLHELTLDEEQRANASLILKKSEEYGLNPELVLAIAYAESGFRQNAKSDYGARGVMQISEDTAKRFKCDPTNLEDNIDCGMRVIKSHIDNPRIGDDPWKIIAAYNTKSSTLNKFLDAYDKDPETSSQALPQATRDHMMNIAELHGGKEFQDLPSAVMQPSNQQSEDGVATISEDEDKPRLPIDTSKDFEDDKKKTQSQADKDADIAQSKGNVMRATGAGAGLVGGSLVGTATAYGAAKADALRAGIEKLYPNLLSSVDETISPTATAASTVAKDTSAATTSGGKWAQKTGYGAGEGTVADVNRSFKRIAPDPSSTIARRNFEKFGSKALTAAQNQAASNAWWKQHFAEVDAANAAKNAAKLAPLAQDVSQVATKASPLSYALKLARYPVVGALQGLNLGYGAADVYDRYFNQKDKQGAALSGTGTALGLISPFLGGVTGPLAMGASAGIPLYQAAGDRLKYLQRHPEEYQLSTNPYDPMGSFTGFGNP